MKLSVIIIEYHCIDDVVLCLESIGRHLDASTYEAIVVSNSEYTGEELQSAKTRVGSAHFLRAERNLGYAGGVNSGISVASGDYIYVLNPDCILIDNKILDIVKHMDHDPKWVIAGPKVIDEEGAVQPSCRRFPKPWTFLLVRTALSRFSFSRNEQRRYLMQDFDHEETGPVDWVSGGAMLVKAGMINYIGEMDERYFLYMEDVDWCHMAWGRGFKVMYCPESIVIHSGQHRSISGGVKGLISKHVRLHLVSMAKYFIKFGLSSSSRQTPL